MKPRQDLVVENLALLQQLAVMKQRRARPLLKRGDRLFWYLLSRLWSDWRSSLHIVQPATVIGWHRQGFKAYWRWKSRRLGRPTIDPELRKLIRQMCRANPLWGAPRIHGELLKLGFDVCEATVSNYMLRRRNPPSQSWKTFLQNHLSSTNSVDFFTVPTATFRILYVFLVLSNDRRKILHFNVTEHPTGHWTARQIVEVCAFEDGPRYLIRDRDAIYGTEFRKQLTALGIEEVVTAARSPWQNPYAERVVGSIRRECIEHLIVLGERHLKTIVSEYIDYYNKTRTHLSLEKDAPERRKIQPRNDGKIVPFKRVGGLHHEYCRVAA